MPVAPEGISKLHSSGLQALIEGARSQSAFADLHSRVDGAGVESWLKEDEKALLYGIAAFAPGLGRIVEIGSWHGSSACYLAGGVMRRGEGGVTCVDPHLGGPPWLGLRPERGTFKRFSEVIAEVGVATVIDARVGESVSLAATWPAEQIDVLLIDGDHSFTGVMKDFECWAPKVRTGGVVLIDDADDGALPELLEAIELLKGIRGVTWVATIEGFAVYQRDDLSAWSMLEDLSRHLAAGGIRRSWNMEGLQEIPLPSHYAESRTWTDGGLDTAYEMCFLARCGPGAYGFTPLSNESDRELLHALSRDRGDGAVLPARPDGTVYRALLSSPEETTEYAPLLQPGGVLIARAASEAGAGEAHRRMVAAGLDGSGWFETTHWGVQSPHRLSADAILDFAVSARAEHRSTEHG